MVEASLLKEAIKAYDEVRCDLHWIFCGGDFAAEFETNQVYMSHASHKEYAEAKVAYEKFRDAMNRIERDAKWLLQKPQCCNDPMLPSGAHKPGCEAQ
jgi:hypothetical protein